MCVVVCVADVWMVVCMCKGRENKLGDVISSGREELRAIFALFSLFFLLINLFLDFLQRACNSFGNAASSVALVFLKNHCVLQNCTIKTIQLMEKNGSRYSLEKPHR